MKAEKIKGYACAICGDFFEEKQDALECCQDDKVITEKYLCSECNQDYDFVNDALECCQDIKTEEMDLFKCPECGDIFEDEMDAKRCCK